MTIDALEHYIISLEEMKVPDTAKISSYTTLLNWIKIEYYKNS